MVVKRSCGRTRTQWSVLPRQALSRRRIPARWRGPATTGPQLLQDPCLSFPLATQLRAVISSPINPSPEVAMRLAKLAGLFLAVASLACAARFGVEQAGKIVRLTDPQGSGW